MHKKRRPSAHSPAKKVLFVLSMYAIGSMLWVTTEGASNTTRPTPPQPEGPFYPDRKQIDQDADLTMFSDRAYPPQGTPIWVIGRVTSEDAAPIEGAHVEIWQADGHGRYPHSRDRNPAPLDANFQAWGKVATSPDGLFRFKTIMPGSYPNGPDWTRPPHIHFKIFKTGYRSLTTQMYFPGEKLNQGDSILQSIPQDQRAQLIAQQAALEDQDMAGLPAYRFDVVLERDNGMR